MEGAGGEGAQQRQKGMKEASEEDVGSRVTAAAAASVPIAEWGEDGCALPPQCQVVVEIQLVNSSPDTVVIGRLYHVGDPSNFDIISGDIPPGDVLVINAWPGTVFAFMDSQLTAVLARFTVIVPLHHTMPLIVFRGIQEGILAKAGDMALLERDPQEPVES